MGLSMRMEREKKLYRIAAIFIEEKQTSQIFQNCRFQSRKTNFAHLGYRTVTFNVEREISQHTVDHTC